MQEQIVAKCVFHTFEKIEFKGLNRHLKFRKCIWLALVDIG